MQSSLGPNGEGGLELVATRISKSARQRKPTMNCRDGRRFGASAFCLTLSYGIISAVTYFQLCGFVSAQTPGAIAPKLSAAESLARSVEASFRNDAALADVFFIDQATGWAVGDRG